MTARPSVATAAAPTALAAFLRGVERRAALFAQLQCGDAGDGDAALALALPAFAAEARQWPLADWSRRFWSGLLATPPLRGTPPQHARWPAAFAALVPLGSGPRAALLLRLVAGLEEAEAAAVLGLARPTYRFALQRVLPRRADGSADAEAWHALEAAVAAALQQLPAQRLVSLARLREAALAGARVAPVPRARPRPSRPRGAAAAPPRWLLPLLWSALAACALAFAATFLPALRAPPAADGSLRIQRAPLPAAAAPAATFDPDTALLSHRDFEWLLSDPDPALLRDLDFYAWYAAELATQPATALPLPEAAQPLPAATEDADATP